MAQHASDAAMLTAFDQRLPAGVKPCCRDLEVTRSQSRSVNRMRTDAIGESYLEHRPWRDRPDRRRIHIGSSWLSD
jgi:hypothetical protein